MSCLGEVLNGVVILEDKAFFANGTKVRVERINSAEQPTLAERLKDFIGKAEGLPTDLAKNHDHYLHGQPKK